MSKFLIEIPHPHFVHFFKNIIDIIGHENVKVVCQDTAIIISLLENHNIEYSTIGKKYNNIIGKLFSQVWFFFKFVKLIKVNKINIVIGLTPSALISTKFFRNVKNIFFDDDDSAVQPLNRFFTIPFANYVITPKCLAFEDYGKKHYTYKGFQELAYLSPKYFKPSQQIIKKYNLRKYDYILIRFNDFKAHHDIGHSGISKSIRKRIVEYLSKYFQVYITTEGKIDHDLKKYQLNINPIDIHHIIYYAKMYIGDSQTMASEAAVLGTPSIRCNTFKDKISYLNELEYNYGLTYSFLNNEEDQMLCKIKELIENNNLDITWEKKKNKMLQEMEDVNEFIIEFIKKINTKK